MSTFQALMLPLAVLLLAIGCLIGGRAGQILDICAAILAGVVTVLVLAAA